MGRITLFSVDGLDLRFYSSDHEPPHFHARKPGCWEVRIFLLVPTYSVKWQRTRISQKEIDTLLVLTEKHRADLLGEWEANVEC